jgi:hypothetical protein
MRPSRGCFRTVFCKCPRRAHSVPFYRERVKTTASSYLQRTPTKKSIGWCHICSRYDRTCLPGSRIWCHETHLPLDLCGEPIIKVYVGVCIVYADHHSHLTSRHSGGLNADYIFRRADDALTLQSTTKAPTRKIANPKAAPHLVASHSAICRVPRGAPHVGNHSSAPQHPTTATNSSPRVYDRRATYALGDGGARLLTVVLCVMLYVYKQRTTDR